MLVVLFVPFARVLPTHPWNLFANMHTHDTMILLCRHVHVPTLYMYQPLCTHVHVPTLYMYQPLCTHVHVPTLYMYQTLCTHVHVPTLMYTCTCTNPYNYTHIHIIHVVT